MSIVRTDCDRTKIPSQSPDLYQGETMIQRLQKKRNEEGFTLIELLIVIIVLGILAAIVVFAVGSTRSDAVESSCRTAYKSAELSAEAVLTKTGLAPATTADLAQPAAGALLKSPLATSGDYFITYTKDSTTSFTLGVGGSNVAGASSTGADNSVAGCKKA
jgi:prepilin-type N-terminal cleavage/methylation domain-containing protein